MYGSAVPSDNRVDLHYVRGNEDESESVFDGLVSLGIHQLERDDQAEKRRNNLHASGRLV